MGEITYLSAPKGDKLDDFLEFMTKVFRILSVAVSIVVALDKTYSYIKGRLERECIDGSEQKNTRSTQ